VHSNYQFKAQLQKAKNPPPNYKLAARNQGLIDQPPVSSKLREHLARINLVIKSSSSHFQISQIHYYFAPEESRTVANLVADQQPVSQHLRTEIRAYG